MLAVSGTLGLSVVSSIVFVNAITLAGSLLALYSLARLLEIRNPGCAAAAFACLAANAYFFRMARPDAILPLMAMVSVLATMAYSRTRKRRFLWAIGIACGAACKLPARVIALTNTMDVTTVKPPLTS